MRSRISCLAPNSRTKENMENTFHLHFDNYIMVKIIECTNTRINETIAYLQQSDNFNESSKYTWIKRTDRVEIDALFGLMYFKGILGVNLSLADRLFSNEIHFVFAATMSTNHFRFLKGHICFHNAQERIQVRETDRFAAVTEIWEILNSNISKHDAALEYLSVDKTIYPMRQQLVFHQYNNNKPHRYDFLLNSLNYARFPYTYKAVLYAAKSKVSKWFLSFKVYH